MIYVNQRDIEGGLGSWFSRAVANVGYFVQQTDLVSHAANELGVGKSTVGKILVPTSSNLINENQTIDKKKIVLTTVNAANCARNEFKNDPRCIEFAKTKALTAQSQQIIDRPDVALTSTNNKSTLIIGGGILLAIGIVIVASVGNKKS